jgi:hypothetical protein
VSKDGTVGPGDIYIDLFLLEIIYKELGTVVHTCNPSYSRRIGRKKP